MRAYPIIVLHQGNHDYLRICLEQAKFTNPNSRIILLGDKKAQSVAPDYVEFYDTKDYFNTAKEFSKVYKHHSTNYYEFELFCIQRWFIVNEFIQKNNIEYFLHIDSDVLLYADFEKENVYEQIKDYDMTISNVSGHTSFFNNKETLQKFCDFTYDLYKNDKEFFKQFKENPTNEFIYYKNIQGYKPLSDMTLLHFFTRSNIAKSLDTGINKLNGCIINDNLNHSEAFVNLNEIRQIIFDNNNKAYFLSVDEDIPKPVRIYSAHFQGRKKSLMKDLATCNRQGILSNCLTIKDPEAIEFLFDVRIKRKRKRNFKRILSNIIEVFIPSKRLRRIIRTKLANNYG